MSVVEFKKDRLPPVEENKETGAKSDQQMPGMWQLIRDLYRLTHAHKRDLFYAMLLSGALTGINMVYQFPWKWAVDSIGKDVLFKQDLYFVRLLFYTGVLWAIADVFLPFIQQKFIRARVLPKMAGALARDAMECIGRDPDAHKDIEPVRLKTTRDQIAAAWQNLMNDGANIIGGACLFIYFIVSGLLFGQMPQIAYTLIGYMGVYIASTLMMNVVTKKPSRVWNDAQSAFQTVELRTIEEIQAKRVAEEEKVSSRRLLPSWAKKVPVASPVFKIAEDCQEFLSALDKFVTSSEDYQTQWLMFDILLRSFGMLVAKIIACFTLIYYADGNVISIGAIPLYLDWIDKSRQTFSLCSGLHEKLANLRGNLEAYPKPRQP